MYIHICKRVYNNVIHHYVIAKGRRRPGAGEPGEADGAADLRAALGEHPELYYCCCYMYHDCYYH